jgi:hypothetical protein
MKMVARTRSVPAVVEVQAQHLERGPVAAIDEDESSRLVRARRHQALLARGRIAAPHRHREAAAVDRAELQRMERGGRAAALDGDA